MYVLGAFHEFWIWLLNIYKDSFPESLFPIGELEHLELTEVVWFTFAVI